MGWGGREGEGGRGIEVGEGVGEEMVYFCILVLRDKRDGMGGREEGDREVEGGVGV